jgi:hypothetical protein
MREWKTAAQTILGDIKELSQGRSMIYCMVTAGQTATNGVVYGTKPNQALHSNVFVNSAAAVGAKEVLICAGATAIAKDEYKDGFLLINDAAGEGYSYMIERHASAASGTGIRVYLKDGVEVALTTASQATLCYNRGCVIPISTLSGTVTATPAGVQLVQSTATQTTYQWMGKTGPWATIAGNAPTAGEDAYLCSAGVSVRETAGTSYFRVGRFLTTAAATEYVMVDFSL